MFETQQQGATAPPLNAVIPPQASSVFPRQGVQPHTITASTERTNARSNLYAPPSHAGMFKVGNTGNWLPKKPHTEPARQIPAGSIRNISQTVDLNSGPRGTTPTFQPPNPITN